MPQLLHLDGRPQTWAELHARLEKYYALKEAKKLARSCGACLSGSHYRCTGYMRRELHGNTWDLIACQCDRCWE